jgi:hypothetical protein
MIRPDELKALFPSRMLDSSEGRGVRLEAEARNPRHHYKHHILDKRFKI